HIRSYHDRSDGGQLVTTLEMALPGHCGQNQHLQGEADNVSEQSAIMFNEELGPENKVGQDDTQLVLAQFIAAGQEDCVAEIG
ncbi:hypothetical protein RA263_28705, partial [Pseudomonas syringae pv. tagetis]|uniref:hypothetical protein n=1 Tax=Pseudomonas syringae group genomosp. 7 TaxID=251699 RepID=UPI003770562D